MNDELTPSGLSPELEARIVALLLGEASDFERDEIERLVEEREDVREFKNQMQVVYGLLEHATGDLPLEMSDPIADKQINRDGISSEWKLSEGKRGAVLALFNDAEVSGANADSTVSKVDSCEAKEASLLVPNVLVHRGSGGHASQGEVDGDYAVSMRVLRSPWLWSAAACVLLVFGGMLRFGRWGRTAVSSAIMADSVRAPAASPAFDIRRQALETQEFSGDSETLFFGMQEDSQAEVGMEQEIDIDKFMAFGGGVENPVELGPEGDLETGEMSGVLAAGDERIAQGDWFKRGESDAVVRKELEQGFENNAEAEDLSLLNSQRLGKMKAEAKATFGGIEGMDLSGEMVMGGGGGGFSGNGSPAYSLKLKQQEQQQGGQRDATQKGVFHAADSAVLDSFGDEEASANRSARSPASSSAMPSQPSASANGPGLGGSPVVLNDSQGVENLSNNEKSFSGLAANNLRLQRESNRELKESQRVLDQLDIVESQKSIDEATEKIAVETMLAKRGKTSPFAQAAIPTDLPELDASKNGFSTFSLHVSDVSFKLAQAALAKGQWPDASRIRSEEFLNAFDYGDPMPTQSERVSCRIEQAIHPFLQQRNLLRVSMRTAAAGRSSSTPLKLTFLLDNSGSMERVDRQQTVRRAFAVLAQQLKPMDEVTLISFARQPRLLADRISGAKAQELLQIIKDLPSEGGTNLESALRLAFEKAQEQYQQNAQNRIVLLTDGAVNLGDASPERMAELIVMMRNAGVAFDAAGISADGLNDEVLEALTRKGDGRYYLLDSLESVEDGFAKQIAGALRPAVKNVKIQVEFNPQRVGKYKLLGFEKHRLNKEDFRNDKVDAAEMAAAENGVALYQVQTKADGFGDIGTVSVRFRDLDSGEMVEELWPIPYETNALRSDLASSSMKIATVASLFAIKLKGDAMADTIDLKELASLVSTLPPEIRRSQRIKKLEVMIQQARLISGD